MYTPKPLALLPSFRDMGKPAYELKSDLPLHCPLFIHLQVLLSNTHVPLLPVARSRSSPGGTPPFPVRRSTLHSID